MRHVDLTRQMLDTRITKRVRLPYMLSLPDGFEEGGDNRWPLIVFLHGAGERGDDPELLTRHGIPRMLREGPPLRPFPFITVSPHCPEDTYWWDEIDALRALLETVCSHYPVDLGRLYLTGISMGGYGTWDWAAFEPQLFAAIAPICGGGDPMHGFPNRACTLINVPVWVFHGALDLNVPISESASMVKVLRECGGDVRFTVYPYAEHDSWTETYQTAHLYTWFLEHARQRRND